MQLHDFSSVVLQYKVVCFDAYGVLKNHKGIIPGVQNTIHFLQQHNIDFYILTNDASRSPQQLADGYQQRGIPEITANKMISSGMMAWEFLRDKVDHGTVAYLGTSRSAHYVEDAGLKTVSIRDLDIDHADSINALVLLDDEGFNWETDLNKAVNLLRARNIPVIVANSDYTYPTSRNQVAIAVGGLADMLEKLVGKTFIRFGKPDSQMFTFAYNHIRQEQEIRKRDILMVGDTLRTDILGGNKFGIDTVLVLTGNTLSLKAQQMIERTGIIPDYICQSVVI
ncbi:MAG: TIGR01459 family HAD-type hydrolase [Bacteroidota bacterium]